MSKPKYNFNYIHRGQKITCSLFPGFEFTVFKTDSSRCLVHLIYSKRIAISLLLSDAYKVFDWEKLEYVSTTRSNIIKGATISKDSKLNYSIIDKTRHYVVAAFHHTITKETIGNYEVVIDGVNHELFLPEE